MAKINQKLRLNPAVNIEGARSTGMHEILFAPYKDTESKLETLISAEQKL